MNTGKRLQVETKILIATDLQFIFAYISHILRNLLLKRSNLLLVIQQEISYIIGFHPFFRACMYKACERCHKIKLHL